jgi:hypothetical protein
MEDFYITLESGSSMDFYPENTISSFKNKFGEPVRVEEDYEVCLVDCSYVHSSILVSRGEKIGETLDTKETVRAEWDIIDVFGIVKAIENWKYTTTNKPKIKVVVDNHFGPFLETFVNFEFETRLKHVFGWSSLRQDYTLGIFPPAERTHLLVYCSIIEGQRVGNEVVPLLRKMSYVGRHNQVVTRNFPHLQYLGLAYREFDTIWIYLKNESGRSPPFINGSFTCVLHFRRRRY